MSLGRISASLGSRASVRIRTKRIIANLLAHLAAVTLTAEVTAQSSTPEEDQVNEDAEIEDRGSQARIKKPVPKSTPVPDIAGEWEPTNVLLELVISSEGQVESAAVLEGREPFSTVAEEAALDFTFEPARHGDRPVPSRIHFLVSFAPKTRVTPPATSEVGTPQSQEGAEPQGPMSQAQSQTLEEVYVYGDLPDPGATTLTRAEVRNLAGAFDDPLRSIEVMPGVTPIVSGLPLFFIRGAPPGNVGFYIDGIRIPLLYHAFLGPSVVHPAFIKQVNLSAGPIPTRFGRIAGGVVEAELAEPEGEMRGEASLRLIDAGAFVEAPINDGRGYALIGGRYSYTALLISAFSPGTRLDYWDYQGLFGYRVGKNDELSVLTLGAFDYVGQDKEAVAGTEYHRIDLRWDHQFDKKTDLRVAATWGRDRTRSEQGFLSDGLVMSRLVFERRGESAVARAGADVSFDRYKMEVDAAISEPETYFELFPARTDVSGGGYFDVVVFPMGPISLIPGVRADFYSSLGDQAVSVDPRMFAEFQLTRNLRAIHGLGVAHQSPNFVPQVPGAQVAGIDGGLQRTLHASTTYEASLPQHLTGSVAFYMNGTQALTDPIGLAQNFQIDETSAEARSLGRSWGVEFSLKRPLTRRLGGLLSYTFSHTLRSYDTITTVPGYDRPHVLNGALTYDFGYDIRASTRIAIASGIPGRRVADTADGFVFDESRSRPYVRLDAKVAKYWHPTPTFRWGLHVEVLNATHSGSVSTRTCGEVSGCQNQGTAAITFPSLGVEAAWGSATTSSVPNRSMAGLED